MKLYAVFHPDKVTPFELAKTLAAYNDQPPYAMNAMAVMYKKMRQIPVFRRVTDWAKVHAVFIGDDDELIHEMATLVTEALDVVVTPEMASDLEKRYVEFECFVTQQERIERRLKIDRDLGSLSDEEAEKLLKSCTIDSTEKIIAELRKTRFPDAQ